MFKVHLFTTLQSPNGRLVVARQFQEYLEIISRLLLKNKIATPSLNSREYLIANILQLIHERSPAVSLSRQVWDSFKEKNLKTIPRQQINAEATAADNVEYSKQLASGKGCFIMGKYLFQECVKYNNFFIHFVSASGAVKEETMSLIYSLSSNQHRNRCHLHCFHLAKIVVFGSTFFFFSDIEDLSVCLAKEHFQHHGPSGNSSGP